MRDETRMFLLELPEQDTARLKGWLGRCGCWPWTSCLALCALSPFCCVPCRPAFWGRQVLSFGHPQCLIALETTSGTSVAQGPLPPPPSRALRVTLLACHGHDSNPTDDPHLLLHPSCVLHQSSHFGRELWLLPQWVRSRTLLVWCWNQDLLLPGGSYTVMANPADCCVPMHRFIPSTFFFWNWYISFN